MLVCWATLLFLQFSRTFANHNNPGYQYGYYVRDVKTGDYKTQEESRVGDLVRGSYTVGEPNGDLRVVTYQADKNTGFNAHVQVQPGGVKMLNDEYNPQPIPEIMMRSIPRYQKRTGFPQLEIKVVPPLSQLFQNKPTVLPSLKNEEDSKTIDNEKPLEVANVEIVPTTAEQTVSSEATTQDAVFNEMATTMNIADVNVTVASTDARNQNEDLKLNKESNYYKDHLCEVICKQKPEEEGRAHPNPDEDKVQVEMEQVIRAEIQEPTTVYEGIPYKHYQQNDPQNQKQYIPQTNPIKYRPQEQSQPATYPTKSFNMLPQMVPSPYYQSKLFLFPFNTNNNDYLTAKTPLVQQQRPQASIRDEQNIKQISQEKQNTQNNYPLETTNQQQTSIAHIYPVYTTGLAFIVMPRIQ